MDAKDLSQTEIDTVSDKFALDLASKKVQEQQAQEIVSGGKHYKLYGSKKLPNAQTETQSARVTMQFQGQCHATSS